MKKIYIMRHAKSDWDNDLGDFDRPLNKRGEKAAPLMGEWLLQKYGKPDLILASPAKRAKQTAVAVAKACGYSKDLVWDHHIYLASSRQIITVITNIPNHFESVLLIGHNPTLGDIVLQAYYKKYGQGVDMPTGAVGVFEVDIKQWADFSFNKLSIIDYETPK